MSLFAMGTAARVRAQQRTGGDRARPLSPFMGRLQRSLDAQARQPIPAVTLTAATPAPALAPAPVVVPAAAPAAASPLEIAAAANVVQFLRQLAALIPSEILGVYIIAVAGVSTAAWSKQGACSFGYPDWNGPDAWLWTITLLCAISCPLLVLLIGLPAAASLNDALRGSWWGMTASLLGMLAISTYIGHSVVVHCLQLPPYAPTIIAVGMMLIIYVANASIRAAHWPSIDILPITVTLPQVATGQPVLRDPVVTERIAGQNGSPPTDVELNGRLATIAAPYIVPVFIGDYWDKAGGTERTDCEAFLSAFTGSTLYQKLGVYNVGPATIAPRSCTLSVSLATNISDTEIQQYIADGFAQLGYTPDSNTVAIALTPKGITVNPEKAARLKPGEILTGYHWLPDSEAYVYAVVIYPNTVAALGGDTPSNALASEICHELAEALTNPAIAYGGYVAADGREIGDLCQSQPAQIGGFNVQQLYIKGVGCSAG